SLHKYLYAHANPVNRVDPGGRFDFTVLGQAVAISEITWLILPTIVQGTFSFGEVNWFFRAAFYSRNWAMLRISDGDDSAWKVFEDANVMVGAVAKVMEHTHELIEYFFAGREVIHALSSFARAASELKEIDEETISGKLTKIEGCVVKWGSMESTS